MVENWNAQRFFDEVLRDGKLAAVGFYSDGDPMCRGFCDELDRVAGRFSGGLLFGKIDVKREEALAEKYAVRSVPTFMVFCEGRGVREVVGETNAANMRVAIGRAINRAEGWEGNYF